MGEIYLEILPVDKALRITAVDAETGVEVVFTAPTNASRARIDRVAAAKLRARIAREQGGEPGDVPVQSQEPERGKLV